MKRALLAGLCAAALVAALPAPARAACPDEAAMEAVARSLLANQPIQPLGGEMSLEDGRCAQDRLVRVMQRSLGRTVGWKVGLTNDAAQARFRVPHPLAGPIYEATVRAESGATVATPYAAVPVIEADLVVRVADEAINDLAQRWAREGASPDHAAILAHLDQVIPFIEMPDLALAEMGRMDGPNLLAIGVGARLGVVGAPITPPRDPAEAAAFAARLGSMTVVFADDTRELARAPGTALLGHPLNVIPWLARDLAARGTRLRQGDLISLGGFSPALPAQGGRTYTTTYSGLMPEPVSVSVTLR